MGESNKQNIGQKKLDIKPTPSVSKCKTTQDQAVLKELYLWEGWETPCARSRKGILSAHKAPIPDPCSSFTGTSFL